MVQKCQIFQVLYNLTIILDFSGIVLIIFVVAGIDENDGPTQLAALDGLVCQIVGLHFDHDHFDYRFAQGKCK